MQKINIFECDVVCNYYAIQKLESEGYKKIEFFTGCEREENDNGGLT